MCNTATPQWGSAQEWEFSWGMGREFPCSWNSPTSALGAPCTAGRGDKAPLAPELTPVPLSSVQVHQGTPWVSVGSSASSSSQLG